MTFTHDDEPQCTPRMREMLRLFASFIDLVAIKEQKLPHGAELQQLIAWYLDHHCARCGACDAVGPLTNGLCFVCQHAEPPSPPASTALTA